MEDAIDDTDAIAGLKQLGLSTYEARVFVALQKLGAGTASEISSVVDVPRSQVYGAADGLEERGLVETRQSTPTVYRPVSLDQARRQLLDQLARTGSETFDYLEQVQDTHAAEERTESIWLISAHDAIVSRSVEIAESAENRLLYALADTDLLETEVGDALEAAAERGVAVVVASAEESALEAVPESSAIETFLVPAGRDVDVDIGRVLVADGDTILLSTHSTAAADGTQQEIAFWAGDNPFAALFVELVEGWLQDPFDKP